MLCSNAIQHFCYCSANQITDWISPQGWDDLSPHFSFTQFVSLYLFLCSFAFIVSDMTIKYKSNRQLNAGIHSFIPLIAYRHPRIIVRFPGRGPTISRGSWPTSEGHRHRHAWPLVVCTFGWLVIDEKKNVSFLYFTTILYWCHHDDRDHSVLFLRSILKPALHDI